MGSDCKSLQPSFSMEDVFLEQSLPNFYNTYLGLTDLDGEQNDQNSLGNGELGRYEKSYEEETNSGVFSNGSSSFNDSQPLTFTHQNGVQGDSDWREQENQAFGYSPHPEASESFERYHTPPTLSDTFRYDTHPEANDTHSEASESFEGCHWSHSQSEPFEYHTLPSDSYLSPDQPGDTFCLSFQNPLLRPTSSMSNDTFTESFHQDQHKIDKLKEEDNLEEEKDQMLPEESGQILQPNAFAVEKMKTKKKNRDRNPKIWEFLMHLLANEKTNPSLIKWEDQQTSTFRLVDQEAIARLWASRSNTKTDVTYYNFARALRYHYKSGTMLPLSEKHLTYRCGSKALAFLNRIS